MKRKLLGSLLYAVNIKTNSKNSKINSWINMKIPESRINFLSFLWQRSSISFTGISLFVLLHFFILFTDTSAWEQWSDFDFWYSWKHCLEVKIYTVWYSWKHCLGVKIYTDIKNHWSSPCMFLGCIFCSHFCLLLTMFFGFLWSHWNTKKKKCSVLFFVTTSALFGRNRIANDWSSLEQSSHIQALDLNQGFSGVWVFICTCSHISDLY